MDRFRISSSNSPLRRIRLPKDGNLKRNPHQCPGYLREEITLTSDVSKSAIVSHAFPSQSELCSICGQLVRYAYSDPSITNKEIELSEDAHWKLPAFDVKGRDDDRVGDHTGPIHALLSQDMWNSMGSGSFMKVDALQRSWDMGLDFAKLRKYMAQNKLIMSDENDDSDDFDSVLSHSMRVNFRMANSSRSYPHLSPSPFSRKKSDSQLRPTFRSTPIQLPRIGNIKRQSHRANDRNGEQDRERDGDNHREQDVLDKAEAQERLRHLSDKYDRARTRRTYEAQEPVLAR